MSSPNHNIEYSAADLQRYHAGGMSDAEMHRLEKAALADPFLQDALDGYALQKPDAEVLNLYPQILEKAQPAKVVGIFQNWWKLAAAVLVVGGCVSYFLLADNESKQDGAITVAQQTENPVEIRQADTVQSLINDADSAVNTTPLLPVKPTGDVKLQGGVVSQTNEAAVLDVAEAKAQPAPKEALNKFLIEGRVKDAAGAPVANAEVATADFQVLGVTDSSGVFNLKSKDSDAVVVISQNGYNSAAKSVSTVRKEEIVLNRIAMNDKAASGIPSNNARSNQAIADQFKKVKVISAIPIGGWAAFNTYLKKNTPQIFEAEDKLQQGTVDLSFSIGAGGTPVNILVKNSNCPKCESAAITLLQNGPKWNGQADVTYSVSINF